MRSDNRLDNKKAQLQMGETIFVVFIIIIVIILAVVVYSKIHEGEIKDHQKELRNEQIVSLAHRLSAWSELECSVAEQKEFDCFDTTKLEIFSEFIKSKSQEDPFAFEYYHDLLRDSKIVVREIYPFYAEWVLYENKGQTKTVDRVIVPVSLYDPFNKNYAFGMMELYVYE